MNRRSFRQDVGDAFSEGARLLWGKMASLTLSMEDVTRKIGASRGMVAHWLYGDTRPGIRWASVLESEYGIPIRAWHEKSTTAFVAPATAHSPATGTDGS